MVICKPIARLSVFGSLAASILLTGISSTPSHAELRSSASSPSCAGKLGVHRTIKVSNKNTTLVGVDNHGRIGLRPKELVLTFDDGPRQGSTQKILKALADECIKATFFSLGRSARAAPRLLRRIAREGHTVGTHSQSHPLLTRRNNDGVRAEIRRGVNSIDAALKGSNYKAANFFRYPFLDRSKRTDAIVREMGLVAFHMNIDSWDWRKQTPSQMVALTMRRVRAEGSGIVLFHDIQDKTAAGLPEFLRTIKREGYKIVHIVPGNSNFNYRRDVASRQATTSAKPVKTVKLPVQSSIQNVPELKKTKTVRKRTLKAPHPKSKPRARRVTSLRKAPVDKTQTTQSLSRTNSNSPARGAALEEQLASGNPVSTQPPKKKKFRLFRKIFGKRN